MNRNLTMRMVILLNIIALKVATAESRTKRGAMELLQNLKEEKRFIWPYRYRQYFGTGTSVSHTGTDRFRFLHMGLGKRVPVPVSAPANFRRETISSASDRELDNGMLQDLIKDFSTYQNERPFSKYYLFAKHPEPYLERTQTFRTLQQFRKHNKRAPEEFSESLYPIQAGKQQLEVNLDSTLNIAHADQTAEDTDQDLESELENGELASEDFESQKGSPYDLIFSSPDLKVEYPQERVQEETEDFFKANTDNLSSDYSGSGSGSQNRMKRWWAARMLKQFRSPKSWTRSSESHIDPALYFIGLGK